jgi:hypothetical protein
LGSEQENLLNRPFYVQSVEYTGRLKKNGRAARKPGRKPRNPPLKKTIEATQWRINIWCVCYNNRPDIQALYLVAVENDTLFIRHKNTGDFSTITIPEFIIELCDQNCIPIPTIELALGSTYLSLTGRVTVETIGAGLKELNQKNLPQMLRNISIANSQIPSRTIYLGLTDKNHEDAIRTLIDSEMVRIVKCANHASGKYPKRNGGFVGTPNKLHSSKWAQYNKETAAKSSNK